MNAPQPVRFERRVALCVIDSDCLRQIVCESLEDCGFTALQGADRLDGFDLLHDHERIDLIVLELGRELCDVRAFRAMQRMDPAHGHVPVVVIAESDVDARPLRASLVLRKPLSIENLVEGAVRLVALPTPPRFDLHAPA